MDAIFKAVKSTVLEPTGRVGILLVSCSNESATIQFVITDKQGEVVFTSDPISARPGDVALMDAILDLKF